jgi:hypothetical protein
VHLFSTNTTMPTALAYLVTRVRLYFRSQTWCHTPHHLHSPQMALSLVALLDMNPMLSQRCLSPREFWSNNSMRMQMPEHGPLVRHCATTREFPFYPEPVRGDNGEIQGAG